MNIVKNLLHFKTLYRLGLLGIWSLVFLVHPLFLMTFFFYVVFRMYHAVEGEFNYSHWKRMGYGKSDKKLTHRKLLYLIDQAEQFSIKKSSVSRNYEKTVTEGSFYLDENIEIQLEYDTDTLLYRTKVYFQYEVIATSKGFSWQRINWKLQDMPELNKVLTKYIENIENEFESIRKNKRKQKDKEKKANNDYQQKRRKEIARKAKSVYKKDMSI